MNDQDKCIYRQFDDSIVGDSDQYFKHVTAMTGESLNSKSEIALELASRDLSINQLQAENQRLIAENKKLKRTEQAALSRSARSSLVNSIMTQMVDPEIEDSESVEGSDWDYIGDDEYQRFKNCIETRDLEQQAKGAEIGFIAGACYQHDDFHYEAKLFAGKLRQQAKELEQL